LLENDEYEEESFYVIPPFEENELYEQIKSNKTKYLSRDMIK